MSGRGTVTVTAPIAPLVVSDRTCVAVFGVEWRVLKRWLDEQGIKPMRIGRRPVVAVSVVLGLLEGRPAVWTEADMAAELRGER